jgi:hypothetical protein
VDMSLESSRARRLRLKAKSEFTGGVSRVEDLISARSGSLPRAEMVAQRLLSTLSHLAQFGLAPASPPLLKPPGDDFSFKSILS